MVANRMPDGSLVRERLGRYSVQLAHDVRSPLTRILQLVEAARTQGARLDSGEYLELLEDCAQQALHLVDDVLDLARAEEPRLRPVCLEELARDAAAGQEDLVLDLRPAPVIEADAVLLRQALANLFSNATRYACRDGRAEVTVTVLELPTEWRIGVGDRGPGLRGVGPFDAFRPFVRGGHRVAGSNGLGLAIVASAAKAHGGRAWYEPRPGGGALFWLSLAKPRGGRRPLMQLADAQRGWGWGSRSAAR